MRAIKINYEGTQKVAYLLYNFVTEEGKMLGLYQKKSSPKDCLLFPVLKENLGGYKFTDDCEVKIFMTCSMITTGNINVWVVVGTSWKNSEIIIKLNVN